MMGGDLRKLIESAPDHILHRFACDCAERALTRERGAGREPDPRSWAAIATKRRWIEGTATDEERAAARAPARDAALDAAARAAAWAASSAAVDAARAAASAAASSAACAPALDTERAWQVAHLQALVAEHKQQMFRLCSLLRAKANVPRIVAPWRDLYEEALF